MANKAADEAPAEATEESPDDILWVRNEEGAVHDVTRAHADEYLYETTNAGRRFLLPGWSIVTEDEARESNPQLFGVPDPRIIYNAAERKEVLARREFEAAEQAANEAAQAAQN